MSIKVRPGLDSDLQTIGLIVAEVVPLMQALGNFQWDHKYPLPEHFSKDVINSELWVAEMEIDNKLEVVGVAALTQDQPHEYGPYCDLTEKCIVPHRMAVLPKCQGKGISHLFMLKAEELAVEKGFNLVRVDTNTVNKAMQGLFAKGNYQYLGGVNLTGKPKDMLFRVYEKYLK
jgi:GNAT superfamily N-acetyltransferase